jgi:ribosomal protein S18 acetylase RimI-like enzyme
MEIRAFREENTADVIALWERCGLVRSWNDPAKDIARKMRVQRDLFLVGVVDEILIASIMAGYEGHRGWVNYLAVDSGHRRHGYARALMQHVEKALTAIGCPKLNMQVRATNVGVLQFYRRLGYVQDEAVSLGKRLIRDD